MTSAERAPGTRLPDGRRHATRVLVAGASREAAALARSLAGRGFDVVPLGDPSAQSPELGAALAEESPELVAAFAVDVEDDFDADGWTTAIHRAKPGAAVAFAWSRPGSDGWAGHCEHWLDRTPPVNLAGSEPWGPSAVHRSLELPADPRAAAAARRLVHTLESPGGPALDDSVALAVSELATNAAMHGQPPIRLDAVADDGAVYIAVQDRGSGRLPRRREADRFDEAGRGLAIVAAVADWWGVTAQEGNRLVWCVLVAPS